MGIYTEILGGILVAPSLLVFHSIYLLMAMTEIEAPFSLLRLQIVGVGKTVPSPVAHGVEGDALLVVFGIALQTGNIHGGSEVTVTNTKRSQCVGFS